MSHKYGLQAWSSSKLLPRSGTLMRPSPEPCLNKAYILLENTSHWLACGPHSESIIFIQALLEVHDIDEAVCRAADHPVSGPIAAFWKADLHRQGGKFSSPERCHCTKACTRIKIHCPLTASPDCLMHSSQLSSRRLGKRHQQPQC